MESQNRKTTDFKPGDIVTWDMDKPEGVRWWYQRHGIGPFEVTKINSEFVYIQIQKTTGGFFPQSLMKIL